MDAPASLEFALDARVVKVDSSLGLIFGWGLVCKENGSAYEDLQGDTIPEESMLDASLDFAKSARDARAMHAGGPVGTVVFLWPMTTEIAKAFGIETATTGLMVAMLPDEETRKGFEDGTYTGFSIGGKRVVDEVVLEKGVEDEARDEQGKWTSGGGGGASGSPKEKTLSERHAEMERQAATRHGTWEDAHPKLVEGDKVKITGEKISGQGKTGTISQSDSQGHFHGVKDNNGKFLGYYHESDLTRRDLLKYSDDQERDDHGRFGSGGGGGGGNATDSHTSPQGSSETTQVREKAIGVVREGDTYHFVDGSGATVASAQGHAGLQAMLSATGLKGIDQEVRDLRPGQSYHYKRDFGAGVFDEQGQPVEKARETTGRYLSGSVDSMLKEHGANMARMQDLAGKPEHVKEHAQLAGRCTELKCLMDHAIRSGT